MKRWTPWVLAALLVSSYMATSADATSRTRKTVHSARVSARRFHVKPAMAVIPDTRVYYVREDSDFDLYRYGSQWYLVENGRWYRSASWRGPFVSVRMTLVPRSVRTVPAGYRRYWSSAEAATPSRDEGRRSIAVGEPYPGSASGPGHEPHMAGVGPESPVLYSVEESDYDLYRLGDTWYMVKDGNWFRGDSWSGLYRPVHFEDVPAEIRSIPAGYRKHWVAPGTPVPRQTEDEN